jgi:sirohydrochlorin cobaltochelatase
VNNDALLIVTSESDVSHGDELARRLSVAVANARVCTFGPSIRSDLAAIMANEPLRVVAVPLLVGAEDPLLSDLAGLLRWAATRWKNTHFLLSAPIGTTQHVVGWASRQAQSALRGKHHAVPPGETALLAVGPGGSTPAANAEVCAIARLLWENRDYGWVETAFAQGARPTVAEGIDRLERLGSGLIVVLPLTLIEGSLYRAVHRQVRSANVRHILLTRPLLSVTGLAAVARQRYEDALARWSNGDGDGLAPNHGHDHGVADDPLLAGDALLPPRYRGGAEVRTAAMTSAPLKYDAEGRVAWGEVWQRFCDLALAGGPPHRGTLLEPALKEEVREAPDGYAQVVAEIARGLELVTRLRVVTDAAPGWVGVVCRDEEMAVWLMRAIAVENVSVRREGATLFLPAGPSYRVEKEIKNVITAVAKTYHYWTEHRAAR